MQTKGEKTSKKNSTKNKKKKCVEATSKTTTTTTTTTTIITTSTTTNTSTTKTTKITKDENKKITDYFTIRKSARKCLSDIEKEKQMKLENAIINKEQDGLEVKQIENKGRGVFSTKQFKKGDFIVEYAGELIDYKEAKEREHKYGLNENIGCYMYYFEYKSKKYCVDATEETGLMGRLLNHSKTTSNCHTKLVEINTKPHLILVAGRDIDVGEELMYDYGDRNKESLTSHPWLAS